MNMASCLTESSQLSLGNAQHHIPTNSLRSHWSVALVAMPFQAFYRPSIQIGLLKSITASQGFPVTTLHLNLDFAKQIGTTLYNIVSQRGPLFGDWLFSLEAFGETSPDRDDRLLEDFKSDVEKLLNQSGITLNYFRQVRHEIVPQYLNYLLDSIPWHQFRVVGFTTTFQQSVASFALARYLKQKFPQLITFFGGANFEGEMGIELVRAIDCIDYAIIGEGDLALPEFLIALEQGKDPTQVPSVVGRRQGKVTPLQERPPFTCLDDLPIPDYREFFERSEELGLLPKAARRIVLVPFESARGCWWGQKSQCTFCGLNGNGIRFRAKSPNKVLHELAELTKRHRSFQFEAVDNILDMSYLEKFFSQIIEGEYNYQFFYEVKSNLSREQIRILSQGGVYRIQPGIESLNSHVLKLMRKGVSAIQNINTLRWALYYGLKISWNLIWGFPGETPEDYHEQLTLLKTITHLPPPQGGGRIWMERFSPIFQERQSFPPKYVKPEASYAYVYPKKVDLKRVAYFFDYALENTLPDDTYNETGQQLEIWRSLWKNAPIPSLTFWSSPGFLQIEDLRLPTNPGTYTFEDPLASLYLSCNDAPQTIAQIKRNLTIELPDNDIEYALNEFCSRGLMMRDNKQFLCLALPATRGN